MDGVLVSVLTSSVVDRGFESRGVMVSVLTSSVVDREFESRLDQTKDCNIGIRCFSVKHAALKSKSEDCTWLARNQDAFEWCDKKQHPRNLGSVNYADSIKRVCLVLSRHHHTHVAYSCHDIA